MHRTIYIRHAKAEHAPEGTKDIDRPLSAEGRRSAQILRNKLEKLKVGLVLSSPALRSTMTAGLATGLPAYRIHAIPELYPVPDDGQVGTQVDELYKRPSLGNTTVSSYLNAPGGEVLLQWAEQAKHA